MNSLKPRKVLIQIPCFCFSNLRIVYVLAHHKNRYLWSDVSECIGMDKTSLLLSVMFLREHRNFQNGKSWDSETPVELNKTIHVI